MTGPLSLSLAQSLVEGAATIAFALSGLLEAARARLDAVGVCVVAGLAAFGGGTLRDVLLDRRPFYWVEHADWIWGLLGLCIAAMLFMRARHFALTERAMQWPDAVGLGLFAASGTQISLAHQMPAMVAVILGMVTAVFGGVLRDIVCNQIPRVFSDHRPYALCAFAGGWVAVLGSALGWPGAWSMLAAAATATALRAATLQFGWTLPAWRHERRRQLTHQRPTRLDGRCSSACANAPMLASASISQPSWTAPSWSNSPTA